ncbi:MAG: hypothetical protein KDD33_11575 [Bdellovibrionales bacterium]|nr:hypothetical protein [Bdellovibrionales bacterium]
MRQSDAIQLLFKDLRIVTNSLILKDYGLIFEEEMQEYFPFKEAIMDWLTELYSSEKYQNLKADQLCLLYENDHPFLFIRDLAHMNSWRNGFQRKQRQDHITGLMFSENPTMALESTLCLCRPSLVLENQSQWFDFKQAMNNLDSYVSDEWEVQAWKGCAFFYLYFYLTGEGQTPERAEVIQLIEPYREAIDYGLYHGDQALRQECGVMTRIFRNNDSMTPVDTLF